MSMGVAIDKAERGNEGAKQQKKGEGEGEMRAERGVRMGKVGGKREARAQRGRQKVAETLPAGEAVGVGEGETEVQMKAGQAHESGEKKKKELRGDGR